MEHYQRFEELATTQLLGVSKALPIDTYTEWIDECTEDARPLKKFLIFFEEGSTPERVASFVEVVRTRLADRPLEVVEDVPSVEIAKMIALANEINKPSTVGMRHAPPPIGTQWL